ncbi:MFS transporter [Nonomuraea typhae]|uniref:MFS transporter n=1 Tax=Nonomuraea typhae TaxID=2603600 RepID=UPI001FEB33C5|nr:MFS transporter [Nonomuraea typhae]
MVTVSVGTFTVVTSEMLPVGLLTPMGAALDVSDGTAGLTMSAPGLIAAIAAPAIAAGAGRVDRRRLLSGLMALMVVANLAAALAPSFWVLMAARVVTGVGIGGFWAFAGTLAVRLVPHASVGRATAMIAGGVSVASVAGVPAGTLIASMADWRWAFGVIALLALAVMVALLIALPPLPATGALRLGGVWRDPALRGVLITTGLLVIGHFAAYTYVRPFLELSGAAISLTLLVYGLGGVAGNFASGWLAPRNPRLTLIGLGILIAVATVTLPLAGDPFLLVVLWGVSYGGVSVTAQLWMIKSNGGEAGMAWLSSVFNATIATGALIGGQVVDHVSIPAVMWLGAALALVSAAFAGKWGRSTTTGS